MPRRFNSRGMRCAYSLNPASTHAGMRVPTNYGERYGAGFERLFAEVAAKRKAAVMPFFLDGVAADARLNQADGIHPTAEGYRIIADRLWPYLRPLLRK